MYNNEEIVLDSEDHINTDIDVKNIDKNINANKDDISLEDLQNLLDEKDTIDMDI